MYSVGYEINNKIDVVTERDSIRKTHCTISHTILRENDQGFYLLHGSLKSLGNAVVYKTIGTYTHTHTYIYI